MKKIIALLAVGFLAMACNKIDKPLKDKYGFINFSDSTNKVVLIEEFTGVKCNNCPAGARKIQGYLDAYPNNVVTMAIHSSNFAVPDQEHPGDFRTAVGTQLYNFFQPIGVPSAMFDRVGYAENKHTKLTKNWDEALTEELAKPAQLEIATTFTFNSGTNTFDLKANVRALSALDNHPNLYLSAFLIEDGIISPQTDGSELVENYEHNHMLRAAFNGAFGTSISSAGMTENQIISKSFSLAADPQWKPENCAVIVFVYDHDSYEVLQAHHGELE